MLVFYLDLFNRTLESSYAEGVKPEQRRSRNRRREWALSIQDCSRVMIDH